MSPVLLSLRQNNDFNDNNIPDDAFADGNRSWWFSPTAAIVKWSISLAIFVFIVAFFGGGYIHARRRIKKGLPPMKYHRFMVSRYYHAPPPTAGNQFAFYPMDPYAHAHGQAPPPPVYDPNAPLPPSYGYGKDSAPQAYKQDGAAVQAYEVPPHPESSAELPPREPKKKGGFMSRFKK